MYIEVVSDFYTEIKGNMVNLKGARGYRSTKTSGAVAESYGMSEMYGLVYKDGYAYPLKLEMPFEVVVIHPWKTSDKWEHVREELKCNVKG